MRGSKFALAMDVDKDERAAMAASVNGWGLGTAGELQERNGDESTWERGEGAPMVDA